MRRRTLLAHTSSGLICSVAQQMKPAPSEQFRCSTQTRLAAARRTQQLQQPWSSLSSFMVQSAEQHCGGPLTSEIPLLNESLARRPQGLRIFGCQLEQYPSHSGPWGPSPSQEAAHSALSTVPKCPSLSPWKNGDGSSRSCGAGHQVWDRASFYRTLCSLGCWMEDKVPDNAEVYTPEQARAHMLSIGGEANNVDIDAVIHRMPPVASSWNLDNPAE